MNNLFFEPFGYGNTSHREILSGMLLEYFDETFVNNPQDKVPRHFIPKLLGIISEEIILYKEWLYFCEMNNEFIGFSVFQIDTPNNPLCKREGWGFIREFYIIPSQRRKGYARQMCEFAERKLLEDGSRNIYLTADPKAGIPFWEAMGYVYSGKIDEKNGNKIFEKFSK